MRLNLLKILGIAFLGLVFSADVSPVIAQQRKISNSPGTYLATWLLHHSKSSKVSSNAVFEKVLQRAEAAYLDGSSKSAVALLGALLKGADPQSIDKNLLDNARYDLAGALIKQGAVGLARQHLIRLLTKKPASAFRAPALRKLVDLTLKSRQYKETLSLLENSALEFSPVEKDELAYLKAKALYSLGIITEAQEAFASISPASRFRAQALYMLGIIDLELGDSKKAGAHFCSIVNQPLRGKFSFFFSLTTQTVIENAWLALARIRHDEEDYVRAVDTYNQINKISRLYNVSLYESAWSLFRAGHYRETFRVLDELTRNSRFLPDWPSIHTLTAYSLLGNCFFDRAKKIFDNVAESLGGEVGKSSTNLYLPERLSNALLPNYLEKQARKIDRKIYETSRLISWQRGVLAKVASGMPEKEIDSPQTDIEQDLLSDLSRARMNYKLLAELEWNYSKIKDHISKEELATLARQIKQAEDTASKALNRLQQARSKTNLVVSSIVDAKRIPTSYLEAEDLELARIEKKVIEQKEQATIYNLEAQKSFIKRLKDRIAQWKRQVEIGIIDTVISKKQALEIEVQNLAIGRYPLSLYRELAKAGMIDEIMEYWPYDGEWWPDEMQ
jgi:hypothetical protein